MKHVTAPTITFESLASFLHWLIDNEGKRLFSSSNVYIFYNGSMCSPFRISHSPQNQGNLLGTSGRWWEEEFTIVEQEEEPKEPEWFECIPEGGVLCFVSAHNKHEGRVTKRLRVVTSYDKESRHPFRAQIGWRYAVPAKPEDLPFLSQI